MKKKFENILKERNKALKLVFKNYKIVVDGDFTSEYNFVNLTYGYHHFPIATVATEGEAIAAIDGYMAGLAHGKDNSYVKICDNT